MPATSIALALLFSIHPAASPSGLRVFDATDHAVANAVVRVWMPPSGPHDLASRLVPLCEARTSEKGWANCSVPRLAGALVTVDARQFEPLLQELDGGPLQQVVLRSGSSVRGHIASPQPLTPEVMKHATLHATAAVDLTNRKQTFRFERDGAVDENGDFTVGGLPASEVSVRLDVDGFLPWTAQRKPGEVLEARLQPGAVVRGQVMDEKGLPVEGARVEERGNAPSPTSESRESGRFEIVARALPASFNVSAAGFHTRRIDARTQKDAGNIEVRLYRGEGVSGLVDFAGREPLEHLTMWIETRSADGATQATPAQVTIDKGRFRMDLPAPGTYSFRFDAEDFESQRVADVYVPPRTYADLGRVLIRAGSGAAGTLIDAKTAAPVAGATVELQPSGVSEFRELRYRKAIRAITNADGEFIVSGATEGSYLLRVQTSAYPMWFRPLSLSAEEIRQFGQIALGEGVDVSGQVASRAGVAQPGLLVRFFDEAAESATPLKETTTANNGNFDGVRLPSGRYIVRLSSDRLLLSQPFEISDGERQKTLDLEIPAVRVTGMIRHGGKPVSGGTLSIVEQLDPSERQGKIILHGGGIASGTVMTFGTSGSMMLLNVSGSGEFSSDHVMPGVMTATYRSEDGHVWERQLTVPDTAEYHAAIDLGGTNLDGLVVDQDGATVAGVQLKLITQNGESAASATSTEGGEFEFTDLESGSYAILTRAAGYRARSIPGIVIVEGSPATPMRIALTPGTSGSLTVTLTRSGGSAAEYVPVTLLNGAGLMVRSLPTDSGGVREFDDLPPGQYFAVWSDAYYGAGASQATTVNGDTPAAYSRMLTPGARVRLVCSSVECSAKPLDFLNVFSAAGVDIAAYLSGVGVGMRLPTANGSLVLGRLAPGSYKLRVGVGGTVYERGLNVENEDVVVSVP
jgi:hypothetical protein